MGTNEAVAVRSLKLHEWPVADRSAWAEACRPSGRLTRGGNASHLKPVTRNDLVQRYGLFLDHVARQEGLDPQSPIGATATPEHVATYVAELKQRVSSVTTHGSIAKLRRIAELLDPMIDLNWLREIENSLALEMEPASKFDHIVASDRIILAGLTLTQEAETANAMTPLKRAHSYRNGLMIALLGLCPIRLKNFSNLNIGRNFIRVGESWCVTLSALETKEHRPDERPIPPFLTSFIDRYLSTYRPVFNCNGPALWVGRYGSALGYSAVERIVTETTRLTLGIPISPHLFRTCGASTAYMLAGDMPHLASALLNHRGQKTTQDHYNHAKCAFYGQEFAKLLDDLQPPLD